MNERLMKDFTNNEIMEAFNQMDPMKAPGIDKPIDMTNFCLISLCRVVYKIVAKVLANRLKDTLPMCISQNQSAIVPKRMIHDNILIAHELVHYLQSAKNRPNKGFAIKLDMSKAYDRVEWKFIEEVMHNMGYADAWVIKIMSYVCSVKNKSPFFFVDDALLFIRNKKRDVEEIVNIINKFISVSGQKINNVKSMIMFSPKTLLVERHIFCSMLGMRMVDALDRYLGLPLPIKRKKSAAFTNIINRCTCKVNSWSKCLLSYGGKEMFLKAILQSKPTYAFSVFLAPKGTIEELYSKMSRMWWTKNEKTRVWNMMAGDRLCYPKRMGGIGFRDMHLFNLALLGRQVWRLINFNDTLCFKVLSAKYFPEGDMFRPKLCDKPLFTWTSIAKAAKALNDGFIWQVGDGNTIEIQWDHWVIEGLNGDSICRPLLTNDEKKVNNLWYQDQKRWKRDKVIKLYGREIGECICNLLIPTNDVKDIRTWLQNPHGVYTSKSAYSWLSLKRIGFGPHRLFWRIIWKFKMLPKIKVFSRRIGCHILPTYTNIARIR
ncbi:reverse transcriptase [Gossypium australe]|uniref:Reverse transcriptase n=1 Tax=Gossypium australe TaxID=47621 RepID=A0A5B6WDM0_9ROSI|nr:reverse transcriptase [Gossypium australe]